MYSYATIYASAAYALLMAQGVYAATTPTLTASTTNEGGDWSTVNYPTDCNAYYTSAGASPSALPKWNATQNSAFFSSAYDCLSSVCKYRPVAISSLSPLLAFLAAIGYRAAYFPPTGEKRTCPQCLRFASVQALPNLFAAVYVSHSTDWGYSNIETTTVTTTIPRIILTDTHTTTAYRLTTLCDGYPRVVTGVNASSTVQTSTSTYALQESAKVTEFESTYSGAPFPTPPPSCRLNCAACSMLIDAASYTYSSQYANNITDGEYISPVFCPYAPSPYDTDEDGSNDCQVDVYSAQLFYWPVTTVSGDLCNKTGTTITATPTKEGLPNTSVLNNSITLTSPSVYVSFHNLSYLTNNFNSTQSYVTNTLMAFPPDEILSMRGYHGDDGNFSLNIADLPPNQVPASAYFGQVACFPDPEAACLPIGATAYQPALAFPSVFYQLSGFNTAWTGKSCQLGYAGGGIWDPPVALQAAETAEGPSAPNPVAYTTTSSAFTSTTAAPSITPVSGPAQTTSSAASTESSYTALPESESSSDPGDSTSSTEPTQSSTLTPPADPTQSTTGSSDSPSPADGSSSVDSTPEPEHSSSLASTLVTLADPTQSTAESSDRPSSADSSSSVENTPGSEYPPSSALTLTPLADPTQSVIASADGSSSADTSTSEGSTPESGYVSSSASAPSSSSSSSQDIGGIIAGAIGLSKTSSVTEGEVTQQQTASTYESATSSASDASTSVSGLGQDASTIASQDSTQDSSLADPATAGQSETSASVEPSVPVTTTSTTASPADPTLAPSSSGSSSAMSVSIGENGSEPSSSSSQAPVSATSATSASASTPTSAATRPQSWQWPITAVLLALSLAYHWL
ncbi:hypothetical protein LTR56_022595 [Elasticomyces elasticus]|nr:hypothetical protein LTR56_022595 [Elasticomyces elasticus]KAK3635046.1 hypothetical protein LTR22_019402 [Elasticomyces elasticus]KAK4915756.1 hypothetical protein LTR49_016125 [Elasticomyces elasticus]KAK5748437.1 hypothetical protein LTS12_021512 [Elasticomyces elasticus]